MITCLHCLSLLLLTQMSTDANPNLAKTQNYTIKWPKPDLKPNTLLGFLGLQQHYIKSIPG